MVSDKIFSNREEWSAATWHSFPIRQVVEYNDIDLLTDILSKLKQFSPLVTYSSILEVRRRLGAVISNRGFLLQVGDCAESLKTKEYACDYSMEMSRFIDKLASMLVRGTDKECISFARMAGQMAKPRSAIDAGDVLYRGDLINSYVVIYGNAADPKRMLSGYDYCYNVIKAARKHIYFCHEALLLPYEESLVRQEGKYFYASSTHMLWVGERTRQLDHAHIEFCRGLINPIGVKISQHVTIDELVKLHDILNPNNELDKLIFINRMGANEINKVLPALLNKWKGLNRNAIWICDPMHGNTSMYECRKTRQIEEIKSEIKSFFTICKDNNVHPSGLHLEASYENVTECIDGNLVSNLEKQYTTYCDPRLNHYQAMDIIEYTSCV